MEKMTAAQRRAASALGASDDLNALIQGDFRRELEDVLEKRREADAAYARLRERIIGVIQGIINDFDLTSRDIRLADGAKPAGSAPHGKGMKIEPAYIGPNGETWSGRGKTPRWLRTAEASGADREAFRVRR